MKLEVDGEQTENEIIFIGPDARELLELLEIHEVLERM